MDSLCSEVGVASEGVANQRHRPTTGARPRAPSPPALIEPAAAADRSRDDDDDDDWDEIRSAFSHVEARMTKFYLLLMTFLRKL